MRSLLIHTRLFFLTLAVAGFCVLPVAAQAETNIAVVNIQEIMSKSKAAKSIQSQLDTHRKSFQDEFSKHERELLEQEKSIIDARAELSPEEFAKKRQDFESQLLETRKLVQQRQQALEQAASTALNQLRKEVVKIVNDIAEEKEFNLVVTQQNVIYTEKQMDITDSVMSSLDKSMKKVDLKVETN